MLIETEKIHYYSLRVKSSKTYMNKDAELLFQRKPDLKPPDVWDVIPFDWLWIRDQLSEQIRGTRSELEPAAGHIPGLSSSWLFPACLGPPGPGRVSPDVLELGLMVYFLLISLCPIWKTDRAHWLRTARADSIWGPDCSWGPPLLLLPPPPPPPPRTHPLSLTVQFPFQSRRLYSLHKRCHCDAKQETLLSLLIMYAWNDGFICPELTVTPARALQGPGDVWLFVTFESFLFIQCVKLSQRAKGFLRIS